MAQTNSPWQLGATPDMKVRLVDPHLEIALAYVDFADTWVDWFILALYRMGGSASLQSIADVCQRDPDWRHHTLDKVLEAAQESFECGAIVEAE